MTVLQRASKKVGQKGKGAASAELEVSIRDDWVAEHARQLHTLLPGGYTPLGLLGASRGPA